MQRPVTIDERFSVGRDQPRPGEIAAIAEGGYRSLVNLRPAGEEGQTMRPEEEAAEARAAGLRYVHLPVRLDQVTGATADEFRRMVSDLPAPVLVHCAAGKRAGTLTLMHVAIERGMSGEDAVQRGRTLGLGCDSPEAEDLVRRYVDAHRRH